MIYLDNAATTQTLPFAEENTFFANPSSPHTPGIVAERALNRARAQLAEILHCAPRELTFTSGGTESNNLAILGFVYAYAKQHRDAARPVIVAEPWAHPSVLAPIRHAEQAGLATAKIAPISDWQSTTSDLQTKITGQQSTIFNRQFNIPDQQSITSNHQFNEINLQSEMYNQQSGALPLTLVCLSHINHETGDAPDIPALAASLKRANPNTIIFTDGAQGFCKTSNPTATATYTASDIYTFSGHKCHAPTGIGGIAVRNGIKLAPLTFGGAQENNLRPGTENTAAAIHLAQAAQFLHTNQEKFHAHVTQLRDTLASLPEIPATTVNALLPNPSPYILNLSFPGARGEVLVHMLSERGIYISMGAACKSRNKREKSSLVLMGFPRETAESALRLSFSHLNTLEEIIKTKHELTECVAQLRRVSGWRDV